MHSVPLASHGGRTALSGLLQALVTPREVNATSERMGAAAALDGGGIPMMFLELYVDYFALVCGGVQ